MKKRLFSILLALCMVLCLVPTTAFAESETEEPPVCSCETACTAESMNADCPVCGAEGALPENCAECAQPADDAAVQPEGEVSAPQPKTALTALIGGSETAKDVSTAEELTAAIADVNFDTVRLAGDISISTSLTVNRTVTLDLNGKVLQMTGSGSVIKVEGSGNLTLTDSNTAAEHKFMPGTNGLWVLDEASGTETVTGGVITGGTGYPFTLSSGTVNCGGGVYIAPGGQLTMTGGNIIGCSAEFGGGVCIYPRQNGEQIQFSMSGGSIIGCVASDIGGGVGAYGTFKMSGPAVIRSCAVESADNFVLGGGVFVDGSFEMSGEATIKGCQAISDFANGGGVFVNSSRSFVMSNEAKIENCQAISNSSRGRGEGGGVYLANNTKFTLSGSAVIQNCTATNSANHGEAYGGGVSTDCVKEITLADSARIVGCTAANGSGLYITGSQVPGYGILHANGGSVDGDVVLGDTEDGPCTITGSGGTVFNGKVTVTPGSTIESGTFNGEVTNNGTITGGVFNNTVSGNGTITGGTFNTPMTGSGTESDPYQIGTVEQLKRFRDIVNGAGGQTQNTAACAILTADIVLNDGTFDEDGNYTPGPSGAALTEWSPMGVSNSTVYAGTFDGAGHTIQGLYCNSNSHAPGLFGYIAGATIQDVKVTGHFNADKAEHAGCIVAYSQNSRITGCVSTASINGHHSFQSATGGIVGLADSSTQVSDCINYGTVKCIVSKYNFTNAGGIVGWLAGSSNITNCSNFGTVIGLNYGSYAPPIYVGGIVGSAWTKSISDCYNAGAVRINEQGNSSATQGAGGIAGFAGFNDTYPVQISNCYNVGSVTAANANAMLGGIVGWSGYDSVAITNCYYLTGTAGQVYGYGKATVTATTEKSAFDFGNGTVLALLINSRTDSEHPWNSQCQYLAAAGKTLPVFKTQTGDKHTHDWSVWTSNDDGTHSRRCTCNVVETQNCSGGTATCTQRATCTVCGAEYGDALGHDFTTSWTHDDNEHWKQCSRCDAKDDVSPHTWDSGTITTAPTCTKAGKKTYSCTKCDATKIEPIPATGHSWKSDWTSDATHHWYECDNKNCDVTDNAGKKGYAEHSGGKATCTQNAVCEFCKAEYGEKLPHDFTAETVDAKYLKSAATCTEKAVYYKSCAVCGLSSEGTADEATFFSGNVLDHDWGAWTQNSDEKTHTRICKRDTSHTETENCIDANKDHKCDICDYIISECADDNKDHKCDYCGKKLTEHTGGKVTCKDKAKCEVCGAEYGELDAKNHTDLKHFPATAATKTTEGNIEYWYCEGCGKYYSDKDGTKEIKKADTVTAKLKDDSKSPQTGDTSNLALWIALLFVSGGAAIGTTVVSRKKKYNR